MPTFSLNINTDASVTFTNKLEKLRRSALPVAIRGALNDTGFEMKKNTMPKFANEIFEHRQPNFFKANSRVEPAQGFDIKKMEATVGFLSSGLHNPNTNYAVRDLEDQEEGGTIGGRSFKPLPDARKGKTMSGNVRPNSRISQILRSGNIIDANNSKTNTGGVNGKMQQFIKASVHAKIGGYVLGGKILWRVKSITRNGRNTSFTTEKLFSFKKSGVSHVHATGFMEKAARAAQKEMEFFYILQAKRQIQKTLSI